MGKEKYQWFIEVLNDITRDAIVGALAIEGKDTEENFCGIADAHGNIHPVWQVPFYLIEMTRKNRNANSLMDYRVWNRANHNCVLKRCEFMEKPKRRYSPAKTKPRKK